MSKKTLIITAIIVAVIAIGVSAYITLRQGGEEVRTEQKVAITPEEPVIRPKEPTTQTIDTSDWETYRNEKHGFELKYPSSLAISRQDSDFVRWRFIGDLSYTADPLALKVERENWFKDLYSFVDEKKVTIQEMFIEENKKVPEMRFKNFQKTRFGMEYVHFQYFDFHEVGWVNGIYFKSDSVIISLHSRLHWKGLPSYQESSRLFPVIVDTLSSVR